MPITDDLLPCPFCGEAAYEQAHEHTHMYLGFIPEHGGSYTVECTACSAGVIEDAPDKARALWNRRTAPDKEALAAHVERLRAEYATPGYASRLVRIGRILDEAPATSLARRDARVAAEHIDRWAKIIVDLIMMADKKHSEDERYPAVGFDMVSELTADMEEDASRLRRQAEGGAA